MLGRVELDCVSDEIQRVIAMTLPLVHVIVDTTVSITVGADNYLESRVAS
jgi:hypothetical protein